MSEAPIEYRLLTDMSTLNVRSAVGEPWPRAVADQSWQNSSTNGASGGSNMVHRIIRARNDFP